MELRSRREARNLVPFLCKVLLIHGTVLSSVVSAQFPLPFPPICSQIGYNVDISPSWAGGVWRGWGTSLAWFANWAGGLSPSNRNTVLDLVFSKTKGLGFNIARYNIGGGGNPPNVTARFAAYPWRLTPGFRATPTSAYNWAQDRNQRVMLQGAIARGVTEVQAVAYSPPAWMTISGDTTGSASFGQENLLPRNYAAFAEYLGAVLIAYRKIYNITFRTMSPSNEPLEGWWVMGGRQEGCNLKPASTAALLLVVQRKFSALNIDTALTAVDSWEGNSALPLGGFSRRASDVYDHVSVHGYALKTNTNLWDAMGPRLALARMAAAIGKPIAMSEWGPQNNVSSPFQTALIMSVHISLDINAMGAVSWSYWQAVDKYNPQWGLVQCNYTLAYNGGTYDGPFVYSVTKSYWAMMHYSRWMTAGMLPIKVPHTCQTGLVATYSRARKLIVIVVTNQLNTPLPLKFQFPGFSSKSEKNRVEMFRTTADQNMVQVPSPQWNLRMGNRLYHPPLSITTWIVHGVHLPAPTQTHDTATLLGGVGRRNQKRMERIRAPFKWSSLDAMPNKPL